MAVGKPCLAGGEVSRAPEHGYHHHSPPPPPNPSPSHSPDRGEVFFSLSGHRSAASVHELNSTITPPKPPKLCQSTYFPPPRRTPKPIPPTKPSPANPNSTRTTVRRRRAHRRSEKGEGSFAENLEGFAPDYFGQGINCGQVNQHSLNRRMVHHSTNKKPNQNKIKRHNTS
ncbi:synaptic defective enhancer 1-like [Triticum aestivum]|uniref:synaptic defective enhancer 1-like n=1 Tax=Triticum aestivum TaxID=4565 RepID=UPI001D0159BB|nr:synaptic defective enhancer 1-like [Triticum aestivum]